MINVLYEDNHVLCVEKPVNVPSAPDESKDPDLLSMCREYIREKYNKPGNVYVGLVHRLDRPVGGVMVFAKTSKAASRLSDSVRTHALKKEYLAVIDANIKPDRGTLRDYLRKDSKTNTVHVSDEAHGKYSELDYEVLERRNGKTLVRVYLKTGRSHQIRVQFSSRGWPLVFDQRYNPHAEKGQIALYGARLEFPHPTLKTPVIIEHDPPHTSVWNLFEVLK
jgi:23S rRNA pseudouridine1911/1915/1917 synthase